MTSRTYEQISYRHMFMKWREAEKHAKVDAVANEVLKCYDIDVTNVSEINVELKELISNACKYFKRLWEKNNRTLSKVLKSNAEYFDTTFCLPENILRNLTSKPVAKNRILKPFNDASECTKRRRTEQLRSNYPAEELAYAAQMSLRSSGNNAAAAIVKQATQTSPSRASKILSSWNNPKTIVPYTDPEALAFMIDENLSKSQYMNMRKNAKLRNANLYPSYNKVLLAKQECYPQLIEVTETLIEVQLQSLLDHTCLRILQASTDKFEHFSDDDLLQLTLIIKWGFDESSDHSEYKQRFNGNGDESDSHMFLTSIVPIKVEANGKSLFQNPTPSSTRYCRPLRMQLIKETSDVSVNEKKIVDEQISNLQPFETVVNGKTVRVTYEMVLTMIDGKVCNAITSTASAQRCYLCGAKPTEMNNIDQVQKRATDASAFQFGLSSLHAWIRFMEYFLHVSYRLNICKWQVRGSDVERLKERKIEIQRRFRNEMGLNIDKPRSSGSGTSNDGNTTRRFFRDAEKSSEITGIDLDVIQRCGSILQVLACGKNVNAAKFGDYCLTTARKLVQLYPWYYLPASVHKVLIHGSDIIDHFMIPIGQLSEEAQESLNKIIRRTRENYSRKISRIATNTDVLHRLLELTDPFISSKRLSTSKTELILSADAQYLLDCNNISDDSDTEISDSTDSE